MFQLIVLVAVAAAAAVQGLPAGSHSSHINPFAPQGRIVGGQETSIERFPWQVSLQVRGYHSCGGSIISANYILTAGHCASGQSASSLRIRVGSSNRSSGGVLHEVAKITVHKKYTTNRYGVPTNDVAVLKLKKPIELNEKAQPIGLFDPLEESRAGFLSTISGWGAVYEGGFSSEILVTVDVPIVSKEDCDEAYSSYGGVPPGQICAAYPAGGKDACQGDSGGPMIIGERQAGIVSWGNGCAREGYPGVYTEVATFREWIKDHTDV
ncbi:trypsin-1-like [Trichogramma pretiosum]|uniref:trypsin-1-like n=1 Tax=Trichogramma pretiosum TaxID=7493 RepID=UPI000C71B200|nr:trypsin-1-like [Trichogramma pretiosum]